MSDSFRLTLTLPVPPARVFQDWLSGAGHTAMTGAPATSDPRVNGQFTAWDGYITGHYVGLMPNQRIAMAWRTSEFPAASAHSRVEISLKAVPKGTQLTLSHTLLAPGDGAKYKDGWKQYYFAPMKRYYVNA